MRYNRIGTDIFNASDIVGKTLFARTAVPLKRYAQASAPVVYTAKPGQAVGTVYSWVMDGPTLYWQFIDEKGAPYYAEHRTGRFSVGALQQQGAQTLEDIKEAQQAADNPLGTTVERILKPVALAAAAYFIIKAFR